MILTPEQVERWRADHNLNADYEFVIRDFFDTIDALNKRLVEAEKQLYSALSVGHAAINKATLCHPAACRDEKSWRDAMELRIAEAVRDEAAYWKLSHICENSRDCPECAHYAAHESRLAELRRQAQ